MKIGIMGGTFDPIHLGHMIAAETARDRAGLDEVWFIPTADPPLKDVAPAATAEDRMAMVRLAVEGHKAFKAIDAELRRGGVSYSFDTIGHLKELHPRYSFSYIIGSDRINDLPRWHRIGELAVMADFIGLERPGEKPRVDLLPEYLQPLLQMAAMPLLGISSTDIRGRLAAGLSIRYLVPDSVHDYIRRRGLYGSSAYD